MKTDTKKEYENWVNEVPVADSDLRSLGGRIPDKTTKYGTWMRRNDPIAFEVGYQEWARENRELNTKLGSKV